MLAGAKIKAVKELLADLSREEIIWLNGYLAGLVSGEEVSPLPAIESPKSPLRITIAYGTETGNAQHLATTFTARAKKSGVLVKLISLEQYKLQDLVKEELFFTIISTQGEGEPPVTAKKFYDYLFDAKPSLPHLRYAVLALGDSSYPLFCKTGEEINEQFQNLGGKELLPLQKCDVDFEADANSWFEKLLGDLKTNTEKREIASTINTVSQPKSKEKKYYEGTVLANINLNGRGSDKETYHIEIGVEENVAYSPGDSLAIIPHNREAVVNEIILLTGVDPTRLIETEKHKGTIAELLTGKLNICYMLTSTVKSYAQLTQQQIPETRMDLKDLLRIYPVRNAEQFIEVVQLLKPIAPRLYTISSSPNAHGGEIHLTVSKHSFLLQEEQHFGLCSEFLGELSTGTKIHFYIHKNRQFNLASPDKDIIMIGPGTGVAPFRSFVAERDATAAQGRSWLFFGDRHFTTDFLYQAEWQSWLGTGALTRMNVAFSRDQEHKIYVQQKMKQEAREFYSWMESGAVIYLCGEKGQMNEDVENAIREIVQQERQCSAEEARQYFDNLKKTGQYFKEVY